MPKLKKLEFCPFYHSSKESQIDTSKIEYNILSHICPPFVNLPSTFRGTACSVFGRLELRLVRWTKIASRWPGDEPMLTDVISAMHQAMSNQFLSKKTILWRVWPSVLALEQRAWRAAVTLSVSDVTRTTSTAGKMARTACRSDPGFGAGRRRAALNRAGNDWCSKYDWATWPSGFLG